MAKRSSKWNQISTVGPGLMVVVLLATIHLTVELRSSHPMHGVVDKINENGGPYIGVVMAFPTEELVLQNSGFFVPSSDIPFVDLIGRRFNVGKIKGVDVIYVMTGEQTLNAGITVQVLLDAFEIRGIVHYGIAGSSNDSLSIGDVGVPNYFAFTGSWNWKEYKSEEGELTELKFGAFNIPKKGHNSLAKIEFAPEQLITSEKPMEEVFWLPIDQDWFNTATQLKDVKLQQCLNETYCLFETPKVVYGLRGATADIYLDNAAFRGFLFKEFNVSIVDEESFAVLFTAMSNGVPCIVFRGVSDLAGGVEAVDKLQRPTSSETVYQLAAYNALAVAVEFIAFFNSSSANHHNDH